MNTLNHTENITGPKGLTQGQAAKVAGIALLVMAVAAMVAEMGFRTRLIIAGDAATTTVNLAENGFAARIGLLSYWVILVCDVLTAWGLYVFFQPVNQRLSVLTAWFRLLYAAMFAAALYPLFQGYLMLQGSADAFWSTDQLQHLAMLQFKAFESAWAMALAIFGLHVVALGRLSWQSGRVPKWLAVMLFVAGFVYIGDNLGKLLVPDYAVNFGAITAIGAIPAIVGEVGLAIWLLVKGRKVLEA